MMNNDKLLTPGDIANRLQVNERTVTRWLRIGQLRGFKISNGVACLSERLGSLLASQREQAVERTTVRGLKPLSQT